MTAWLYRSSVPGMSVPGMAVPALDGGASPSSGPFTYLGHVPAFYLDYLDVLTQHTLSVTPGGSYTMIPVNSRAGLTIPPPDSCWLTSTNHFALRIVLRPRLAVAEVPLPPQVLALDALHQPGDALSRARIRNVSLQVHAARQPGRPQPKDTGSPHAPAAVPGPPSGAALALAAARAVNAELQAARARGGRVGC